ncbi:GDP-mannose 4,6-dehydratase, partial [Patescibacteria group bacterium]|nr:GDP-mannose 4,6-dehydratase [Patescibacteria group bacterium]
GQKIPVYGRGLNLRDWLYVNDHCRAIDLVLSRGKIGETYCVGGLKGGVANIKIIKTLLKIMGKDQSNIEFVADRPAHDNYAVNWQKIKKLGWQPQENLETGLQKTITWYTENTSWWKKSKIEAENFYKKLQKNKL